MANQSSAERLIVQLTDFCKVEDFDCGDPARNNWLCRRAFSNQQSDDTVTYVALEEDGHVRGFYALAVGSIIHGQLSAAMRRNAPNPVSCVLLAQLAVDVPYQRKGLGRDLVLHAMGQAVKISGLAGCRLFAVHPDPSKPELIGYYNHYGFKRVDATPLLMVMTLKQVRTLLAAVSSSEAQRSSSPS
jgi:predicted N-acetyltransferase YhbS